MAGDGAEELPLRNAALILGGASCVWEDLARLEAMIGGPWTGVVIAVNDIVEHYPHPVHHLVSLHGENLEAWAAERDRKGLPGPKPVLWTRSGNRYGSRRVTPWGAGSSGLLAVAIAKDGLGVKRAVLCGMPMTMTPHFSESTAHRQTKDRPWYSADGHFRAWIQQKHRMNGWVKSMGGNTGKLLGAPTPEWLGVPHARV